MAKQKTMKSVWSWIVAILVLIILVGIGGLFINGTFLAVILLSYAPLWIHQLIGWVIILGAIIWFIVKIVKAIK